MMRRSATSRMYNNSNALLRTVLNQNKLLRRRIEQLETSSSNVLNAQPPIPKPRKSKLLHSATMVNPLPIERADEVTQEGDLREFNFNEMFNPLVFERYENGS